MDGAWVPETSFTYQTKSQTWSRARRVIAKAEVTAQGDNPRFVVTHLPAASFHGDADRTRFTAARLYEELYCCASRIAIPEELKVKRK